MCLLVVDSLLTNTKVDCKVYNLAGGVGIMEVAHSAEENEDDLIGESSIAVMFHRVAPGILLPQS